jgi:ATP-binding protein involved in chromosome partitioning
VRSIPYLCHLSADLLTGTKRKCDELGLPLLGDIPLHPQICTDADAGKPTVVANPESPQAQAFVNIVERLKNELRLG